MSVLVRALTLADRGAQGSAGTLGAAQRGPACVGPRGRGATQGGVGPGRRANYAPVHNGAARRAERDDVALVQQIDVLQLGAPAGLPLARGIGCAEHNRLACAGAHADLRLSSTKFGPSLACCMRRRPTCSMRCCGWQHCLAPHAVPPPVHIKIGHNSWRRGSGGRDDAHTGLTTTAPNPRCLHYHRLQAGKLGARCAGRAQGAPRQIPAPCPATGPAPARRGPSSPARRARQLRACTGAQQRHSPTYILNSAASQHYINGKEYFTAAPLKCKPFVLHVRGDSLWA